MATARHNAHHDEAETDTTESDGPAQAGADQAVGNDPRATSHPTGEAQAAENAETEPAG